MAHTSDSSDQLLEPTADPEAPPPVPPPADAAPVNGEPASTASVTVVDEHRRTGSSKSFRSAKGSIRSSKKGRCAPGGRPVLPPVRWGTERGRPSVALTPCLAVRLPLADRCRRPDDVSLRRAQTVSDRRVSAPCSDSIGVSLRRAQTVSEGRP